MNNDPPTEPSDIACVGIRQLASLDINGRPCEICGQHMHEHDWADMDRNGFVVDCNLRANDPAKRDPDAYPTPEQFD